MVIYYNHKYFRNNHVISNIDTTIIKGILTSLTVVLKKEDRFITF